MTIRAKRKVVYAKVETTYATDAVPVAGTDALLVHNFSCTPLELKYEERDPALPFFGNQGQVKGGEMMRMEYDIEMAGAGSVDGVAKYASALRGCAMAETITATTGPVTYSQISASEQSLTKHFFWDGLKHVMLGVKGNEEYRLSEGRRTMIHFTWEGIYGGITDVALPTPTLSGFQTPKVIWNGDTVFTLHGYAAPLRELTLNGGKVMSYQNRPNSERVHFIDRKSRGSVTIEVPSIAAKDYFTTIRNTTLGALVVSHGSAGNKILIDAANVQLTNPRYSEADGLGFVQMGMEIRPSAAGNDEYTFKTQ